ncbi:MAG: DUF1887 family protein [Clostridiales bacterium]|nr:DUF1887 family protein [Clostridiales bacterium]
MDMTLIELYDERPLENVLACHMLRPDRVIFLCPEMVRKSARRTSAIRNYLKQKDWNGEIRFVGADMYSAADVGRALTEVCSRYPGCVMDITGGTDAALFASGVISCEKGTPAFTYSRKSNAFYSIKDAPFGQRLDCDVTLSAEDCFIMAGGSVRQGRADNAALKAHMEDFEPFFRLYLRHRQNWTNIIGYIQRVSQASLREGSLRAEGGLSVKGDRGRILCDEAALKDLRELGFINSLSITEQGVSFLFRDAQTRYWLRDIGSVLELYVYKACVDIGILDDVSLSVVVDWEGERAQGDVSNELDVVATKGVTPLFISCKTGQVRTEAINELDVLKQRFGSGIARAAIVSSSACQKVARHRAAEMGISIIDLDEIKAGRLPDRIRELAK